MVIQQYPVSLYSLSSFLFISETKFGYKFLVDLLCQRVDDVAVPCDVGLYESAVAGTCTVEANNCERLVVLPVLVCRLVDDGDEVTGESIEDVGTVVQEGKNGRVLCIRLGNACDECWGERVTCRH